MAKFQPATVKLLHGDTSKGLKHKHEDPSLADEQILGIQQELFRLNQLPQLNQLNKELQQSGRIKVDDSTVKVAVYEKASKRALKE